MIAIEMAKILTAQGESVPHIILIDSLNPEKYPPFHDAREHHLLATLTYNAIARRIDGPEASMGFFARQDLDTLPSGPSSGHASRDNSDGEMDSDDEQGLDEQFYHQMRQHILNGLRMLASHRASLPQGKETRLLETDATLVKCKALDAVAPLLSEHRRAFARRIYQDSRSGWADGQFRRLATAPLRASHDSCLDPKCAGELTAILQHILRHVA
jgi:thioesterase domain-containing protein